MTKGNDKAKRDVLIEYAKELYFKNNSYRGIAQKIQSRYKETLSYVTIKNWTEKFGWKSTRDLAQAKGVMTTNFTHKTDDDDGQLSLISEDEKIVQKLIKDTASQIKENEELMKIALNLIKIESTKQGDNGQTWNQDFCPRKITAATNLLKVSQDAKIRLEALAGKFLNPKDMSDEQLDKACATF